MLLLSKILAIFLAILVITKTYYDYRKHQESLVTFLFWSLAWIGIAYVAIMPGVFYGFMQKMKNENVGIGTFIGTAFVFLFFITYRIYTKANRIEKQIHEVTMKLGLKDLDKK